MSVIDQIISVESGGNNNARNPRSTATGPGQFLESTWLNILPRYRPDLTTGRTREEILSLRTDPAVSRAMTEALAAENAAMLTKAGFQATPGTTYLAHFAGPQGAINLLSANPTAPAGDVLGQSVVKANPFLTGMTAAEVVNWANGKMGVAQSAPPAAAPAPTPTAAPNPNLASPMFASLFPQQQALPMATMLPPMQQPEPPPMAALLEPPELRKPFSFQPGLRSRVFS